MAPGVGVAISPCFSVSVETGNGPTPPGPAWALWLMQEGSGQVVADSSGNGRHLWLGNNDTVESSDPAWTAVAGVTCLEFAGAQFCRLQANHSLEQPFTAYALVRRAAIQSGLAAVLGPSGVFYWAWRNTQRFIASLGSDWFDTTTTATINAWHVVTLVGNGASTRQRINLDSSTIGNAGTSGISASMRIGSRISGDPLYFYIGLVGAFVIVEGVLTEDDDVAWYTYLRAVKGVTL